MRTFLQRGLYHSVSLHAHLELRDLCWYTAITRRPQCSQELASSDSVNYHRPILAHSEQRGRVSTDAIEPTLYMPMMNTMPHLNDYFFVSQYQPGFLKV